MNSNLRVAVVVEQKKKKAPLHIKRQPPPCLPLSEQIQISLRLLFLEDPSIISRSRVPFYSINVLYFFSPPPQSP